MNKPKNSLPPVSYGELIDNSHTWEDLNLPKSQISQLRKSIDKFQQGHSIRALFSGPSTDGKFLAARALASELEKSLYRVDLSAVINKYVGETERNLKRVFQRSEELDVILLLDNGDSLLSERCDENDSHEKDANIEIDYTLQRRAIWKLIKEHNLSVIIFTKICVNSFNTIIYRFRYGIDYFVCFPLSNQ